MHWPHQHSCPATTSAAAVHARRKILIEGDAHLLQFRIAIARHAKCSLGENRICSSHSGLDLLRIQSQFACRVLRPCRESSPCQVLRGPDGEIIRRAQTSARAVRGPFMLDQRFGRNILQGCPHDVLRDGPCGSAIFRTPATFNLRPKSVDDKTDVASVTAFARIFVARGLGAEVRRVGKREEVKTRRKPADRSCCAFLQARALAAFIAIAERSR